jgi:3-hydroxybutyryl-CoA dehydrogenase
MALEKVGVVGAGLMGAEIALVFALAGHEVLLSDTGEAPLAAALERLGRTLDRGIQRGWYKDEEKPLALSRITTSVPLDPFAGCDFITEAVFEDEGVKAETYKKLDALCRPHAIFASNTSTIPISTLASHVSEARRPNFIGTHYFSPASRMKLVEVIPAFDTSEATLDTAMRLMRQNDKVAVKIKDVAGFAVNRMFLIFLNEAVRLVEEGVATPEDIDTACKLGLGHPMGPFELMDVTTSKLCLQVSEILHDAYGERFRPPSLLQQRVKAGFVGGRNARGWRK